MDSLFEKASRMKLRFSTPQGLLPVEDVWDLPLTAESSRKANLNDMAKSLYRALKEDDEVDFIKKRVEPNEELSLRFAIAKHIIDVRLREQEATENALKVKEKKARIMEIMAGKEDEELKGKSLEDLRGLLNSL